jgi:hypothetical protein
MRSPFVDSDSHLSEGLPARGSRLSTIPARLLALALVVAVAASSAVLIAM